MKKLSTAILAVILSIAPHLPAAAAPIDRQMRADMTAHQFTRACYLNRLPIEKLPIAECQSFIIGILSGVRHLQKAGFAPRDLVSRCDRTEFETDKQLAHWVMERWVQRMRDGHPSVTGEHDVAGVVLNIIVAC